MADYSDFEYHRVQRIFYRSARNLALTAVVAAPWLFGCSEPWAYLFVCLISAVSLGFFLLSKVCFPEKRVVARNLSAGLLVLLLLVVVQAVPVPFWLSKILNPAAAEARAVRAEMFQEMGVTENLSFGLCGRPMNYISSSGAAAQQALGLFVAYLGIFVVFANAIRSWRHIQWITTVLLVSSFIMAVLAMLHKFSGITPKKIFWFHMPRYPGDVFGPFTNRNHFAFYLLMMFGLAVGLFCSNIPDIKSELRRDWREKLAWLDPKLASRLVLIGFALAVFGAAIFVSLSRGAVVSLLAAGGVLWFILSRTREQKSGKMMLGGILLLVFAFIASIGWEPVLGRLETLADIVKDPLSDTRAIVTRDTLFILKDAPLLGCGFGCFKHVFPVYQGLALGSGIYLHAHNDWAQLFAEGGVLCGSVFLACVVFFFRTVMRHFPYAIVRARKYVLGVLAGLIAVMFHSLFDYSLHKPANAFLLSAVCGLVISTVHMSAVWNTERAVETRKPGNVLNRWQMKERAIPFLALLMLSLVVYVELLCLRRAVAFERFDYARRFVEEINDPRLISKTVTSAMPEVKLIKSGDTGHPLALREISATLVGWSLNERIEPELRAYAAEQALAAAWMSVCLAPTDYLCWLWMGRAYSVLGRWENAERCLQRARQLRPYGLDVALFEYREQ